MRSWRVHGCEQRPGRSRHLLPGGWVCTSTPCAAQHACIFMHFGIHACLTRRAMCFWKAQCSDNCFGCDSAGPGKCEIGYCYGGFTLTPSGVCAAVSLGHTLAAQLLARTLHAAHALPPVSQRVLCAPGTQCAANCNGCDTAGPGLCDPSFCYGNFGITTSGTCNPVSLRQAWAAACMRKRVVRVCGVSHQACHARTLNAVRGRMAHGRHV